MAIEKLKINSPIGKYFNLTGLYPIHYDFLKPFENKNLNTLITKSNPYSETNLVIIESFYKNINLFF